ncbi:hypothetical protein DL95DRAFT_482702 [Leptodontidium sp. 2 PMI_412]|nr:hypothetical protein DL95DRAFT_482702 [Leptodontidium sp. 2 PMI_412]
MPFLPTHLPALSVYYLSVVLSATIALSQTTLTVPNTIVTAPSTAQFVSTAQGLDAPKVHPVNATTFDWWYFDAVSTDSQESVVIVFYMSTDLGFPFRLPGAAISVDIFVSFADGSLLFYPINSLPGSLGSATVVSEGQGASGVWRNSGFSFDGEDDLSRYTVTIDNPVLGVKGTLVLDSVAPAHYPCDPLGAGANLEVSPHIGWANAIPDANATADFTVSGRKLQFDGYGYHDKNWADQPFAANVHSWYWGHGRLGPYSIVWFDVVGADGNEYISSYAALNGQIIATSCSPGSIRVRPTGRNSQYPPVITSGNPDGFRIDLDLGAAHGGMLSVNVTTKLAVSDVILYTRWIGTMQGSVSGGPVYNGIALYEEFKMSAV